MEYIVKAGDNISVIAQRNNTTVAAIQRLNPTIADLNNIHVGQKITLPSATADFSNVQSGVTSSGDIAATKVTQSTQANQSQQRDSLYSCFSNDPASGAASCPIGNIAIYPVRYAIDESPTRRNQQGPHPLPSAWSTGLPSIKTRNYTMRQLRDGWLYVWDGEKFDEYKVMNSGFMHIARLDKTIAGATNSDTRERLAMPGAKGFKFYLEYSEAQQIQLAYSQQRWPEDLYQKMLENAALRNKYMRSFNIQQHKQGQLQPHTQFIERVADYVADIDKDRVTAGERFTTTTVPTQSNNSEIETKVAIADTQIIAVVPDKNTTVFIALDDHLAILNDLSLQLCGRNAELRQFDETHQHKLYTASIVEQLCSSNFTDEDYPASATTHQQKRLFALELEGCFAEIRNNVNIFHAKLAFWEGISFKRAEQEGVKAAWNNHTHIFTRLIGLSPKTQAFKTKYPTRTQEWFTKKYFAWVANEKSRRQVRYEEALEYLDRAEQRPILVNRIEENAEDLITYLEHVGNDSTIVFLQPDDELHSELLTVNFSTILEQLTAFSEKGKQWYANELVAKKTLVSLISYGFSKEFADRFEEMMAYYLEHKEIERGESSFDPSKIIGLMLAGGSLASATPEGLGALGEIKSYLNNSNQPSNSQTGTNQSPMPNSTPPVVVAQSVPPSVVLQNRMATALTAERIQQSPFFREMPDNVKRIYFTFQETLKKSEIAWESWQRSVFTRTISLNLVNATANRIEILAIQVIHSVTLEGKTEFTPITYTDPYYQETLRSWEKSIANIDNRLKPLLTRRKGLATQVSNLPRGRGKSVRLELFRLSGQIARLEAEKATLLNNVPQPVKTTGYMLNNTTHIAAEDLAIRLRYLLIENFTLTTPMVRRWLGGNVATLAQYNRVRALPAPIRQLPAPTVTPAATPDLAEVNLKGSIGVLGVILIGLNIVNCVNTMYQTGAKSMLTANDINALVSAHAGLASLLFSFKVMPLWGRLKNITVDIQITTNTKTILATEKLMELSPKAWPQSLGPNTRTMATTFRFYAKGFAIFGFIASGAESIQIISNIGNASSIGERNAQAVKAFSTILMTGIAGFQLAALFGVSSWMSMAFGPWMIGATLVLAAIYFISSYFENYFHLEGFDKWLNRCYWGNNYWPDTEQGRKEEIRSLQELLLQPIVYSTPEVAEDTHRLLTRQIHIILPPLLINRELGLDVLLTEDSFWFWQDDKTLGGDYGRDYGYSYQTMAEQGYTRDFASFNQELQTVINHTNPQQNANNQTEQTTQVPEIKQNSDSEPIVWETYFLYDDSNRVERVHNIELAIYYPADILSPRPDGRGYRFKLSTVDSDAVIMGKLEPNNIDATQPTKASLLIDTSRDVRNTTITLLDPNQE